MACKNDKKLELMQAELEEIRAEYPDNTAHSKWLELAIEALHGATISIKKLKNK